MKKLVFCILFVVLLGRAESNTKWDFVHLDYDDVVEKCDKITMKKLGKRINNFSFKLYELITKSKTGEFEKIYTSDKRKLISILNLYGHSFLPETHMSARVAKSCGVFFIGFKRALLVSDESEATASLKSWMACLSTTWRSRLPLPAKKMIECYKKIK